MNPRSGMASVVAVFRRARGATGPAAATAPATRGDAPRGGGGVCAVECLEGRVLMAIAMAAGGSGYSGQLSSNKAIRQQQLSLDPDEPQSGSTSVKYLAQLASLRDAKPGPGYTITGGFVEVQLQGVNRLQPLLGQNGFLQNPAGPETGYVQVRYARSTGGAPGQIAPLYEVVDQRGVQGVDTHELRFEVVSEAAADQTVYEIFAAPANSFSNNAEDFLVTPENIRLGPADLSPAVVFGNPQGKDTAGPVASVVPVTPDPRRTAVNSITINFDEAVSRFGLSDLVLRNLDSGNANRIGTTQTLTTSDNKTFVLGNLAPITGDAGRYVLELKTATSGITDRNGNGLSNSPVENWVLDLTRPTASSNTFLHTPPHRLLFDFSENVRASLEPADVTLVNLTTSVTVPSSTLTFSYENVDNIATFTVSGIGLSNGLYRATIPGSAVADAAGNTMANNSVLNFFVLIGDVNRNRTVDGTDFALLAANFGRNGRTYAQGDLTGNGIVDGQDFALLAANFGKSLPAVSPALTAAAAPGVAAAPRRKLDTMEPRPTRKGAAISTLTRPGPRGQAVTADLRRRL